MKRIVGLGAVLLLAALMSSACGGSTPEATVTPTPTPSLMTKADAAARYLSIVCPVNAANTEWTAVSGKVKAQDAQVGDPVPEELRVAVGKLGTAISDAAVQLNDPLYIWPESAKKAVAAIAAEYKNNGPIYSSFSTADATFAADPGLKDSGTAGATARKALGLPGPGKGCPTPSPTS